MLFFPSAVQYTFVLDTFNINARNQNSLVKIDDCQAVLNKDNIEATTKVALDQSC